MPRFDIIIPHLNLGVTEALAWQCLKSINHHSRDYRLIWVDNGGTRESLDILNELDKAESVIIRNAQNLGFVKAVNQGLAISNAPFVVIMNNDTEVAENWLERLCKPLKGPVGMSGPRTDTLGCWQGHLTESDILCVLPPDAYLAFFCTMVRREVFEKIGYLDEDFGLGFGDDNDYCARAMRAGYHLVVVQNLLIRHRHRTTFKGLFTPEEIAKMQDTALKLHNAKLKGMS